MDIEKGIDILNKFEKTRIEITEMPNQKDLQDFLKGIFGEEEIMVIFDTEKGKFVKLDKNDER